MFAEEEKLAQKASGNFVLDGQPNVEMLEDRRVRSLHSGWLVKLLMVTVGALGILLVILTGLAVHYGTAYQFCSNTWSNFGPYSTGMDLQNVAISKRSTNYEQTNIQELMGVPNEDVQIFDSASPPRNFRLPYDVLPRFYDLRLQVSLKPGPQQFWFNGSVAIKVICTTSTSSIFIHAYSNLNVSLDQIKVERLYEDQVTGIVEIKNISYDAPVEWFHIELESALEAGQYYRVTFGEFRSRLQQLKGWYLSSYEEGNEREYLATSQFEPTDARRAFPCWDEPAFKAVFEITLVRNGEFHSLSNMGLRKTVSLGDDWYADSFHPTLNTSTYLIAFVVSKFDSIQGLDSRGRNFTVWARPEVIHQAKYALETGQKIITFFEDYFEVPYPLEKTDMVAVPDFKAGAMENWGLIIYRETRMLWDPKTDTAASRQGVVEVVVHELAHQWFGNLVTLSWWDDLWLNEGFASFSEVIGFDHVHPEWGMDEQTLLDSTHKVLTSDGQAASRPVVQNVYSPEEINSVFDPIVYDKGASLLRMMQSFMGPETFRLGLKKYLSNRQFQNSVAEDLWNALAEVSSSRGRELEIKSIMDTWFRQKNYPLVTVEQIEPGMFRFTQSRYLDMNSTIENETSPFNFEWQIPLTYGTPSSNDWDNHEVIWLKSKSLVKKVDIDPSQWYVFNLKQAGFYRVNYADSNWKRLIDQLLKNHSVIPSYSRTQMIFDLSALADRDIVAYEVFLDLTKYLNMENNYVPWETARRVFSTLLRRLASDPVYGDLKAHIRQLVDRALQSVDWVTMNEDENHMTHMLRGTLVKLACEVDHQLCVAKARTMFADWMNQNETNLIPPSLRQTVYCTAIKYGGQLEWQFLYNQMSYIQRNDEKGNIRLALPCTRDIWLLRSYMDILMSNTGIEQSEMIEGLISITRNPIGQILLWDQIRDDWLRLVKELELQPETDYTNASVISLMSVFSKRTNLIPVLPAPEELLKLGEAAQTKKTKALFEGYVSRLVTLATYNQEWSGLHRDAVAAWLSKNVPDNRILL